MSDLSWPDVSLGNIFTINTSAVIPNAAPNTEFYHHSLPAWDATGGPTVEKGSSIESNKVNITKPCVLVSKLNPRKPRVSVLESVGKDERHCASTEFVCLEPKAKEHLRFWGHLFSNKRFAGHLDRMAIGSTNSHKRFSPGVLLSLRIELPSEPERRLIARILDTLDTQIQKTEALIAKLEKVKEGLLHDLLTRGIDDNGQLRPSPEQAPELYKESPLGLIPREWNAVRLYEMAENHDGQRIPLKKSERKHGTYPYYGASGIIDWVEGYLFEGSYVLLGEDGENVVSRNLPLAFPVTGRFWVNNHAHIYSPKDDCDTRFLVEVLEQKDYSRWVNGSAQPKITQASLRMMWFCKPPTAEQKAISNSLEAINQQIDEEKIKIAKVRTQKAGVMDDLLTGRVRVTPLLDKAQATTPA
ncbi:restriction endonuclease subunit S [Alkalilimnicola ehrlichii MLHE-1]|uniref:Restriction modification system DNA specificity domain protein n=1 Tax=Alkalilimnicola ehrlichii (strain ATCC BAA-1101 / DSM 17681 / MLHE-1) TaxID=187272 RepID=Q0ABD3_ALKEH|nr:restriction endonuclease subunit S [Alkalilimnicola ehrlichii]ABI55854.1 restriction modification system DNA specificity domain protein [Alkalilimnicola ehrlichii MLHE-1]